MILSRVGKASFVLTLLACVATASSFQYVVAYGDSLSDNGNVFRATGFPPPPYYNGRLSNGPVAVEDTAALLNAQLLDFAWGGATTGIGNSGDNGTPTGVGQLGLPGMQPLLQSSLAQVTPLASSSLFVVWGGVDDFFSPSPLDSTPQAVANRAVSDLVGIVAALGSAGAKDVVVPGMPDLGLTPRFLSQGAAASAQASAITNYFNALLSASLPQGATYVDTASLLRAIVANPGAYGFTNVTSPCLSAVPCSNPDSYLFWDDIHPTAHTQAIVAGVLAAAAVPEPSTAMLALAAGAALAVLRRRIATS